MTATEFSLALGTPDEDGNINSEDIISLQEYVPDEYVDTIAPTEVSRTLSKSPIIIPIPRKDARSFDIGYTDNDSINVTITSLGGMQGDLWLALVNAFKYRVGIHKTMPYKLYFYKYGEAYDDDTALGVAMQQLSCHASAGQGGLIEINITFAVVDFR